MRAWLPPTKVLRQRAVEQYLTQIEVDIERLKRRVGFQVDDYGYSSMSADYVPSSGGCVSFCPSTGAGPSVLKVTLSGIAGSLSCGNCGTTLNTTFSLANQGGLSSPGFCQWQWSNACFRLGFYIDISASTANFVIGMSAGYAVEYRYSATILNCLSVLPLALPQVSQPPGTFNTCAKASFPSSVTIFV